MRFFLIIAGLMLLETDGFTQNNFIRADLAGYFYRAMWPYETRPATGPKFSLAYEKGFSKSGTSIGVQINYGYLPYMRLTYDMIDNSNSNIIGVLSYKGFFLQPEWRYYITKKKRSKINGSFIGGYLHYFIGENVEYLTPYFSIGYNGSKFNTKKRWMLGGGVLYGYKQKVSQKFFIESFIGIGYGYVHRKNRPADENKFNSGDFCRIELAVGYSF